jgi:LPXTG-motif cell wall-anchored protein
VERHRDPLRLARVVSTGEVGRKLGQLFAESVRRALQRLCRREPIYEAVQLVMIAHGALVEGGREGTPIGLDADPTLTFQRDQRLSYRDPADAERLRHVVLMHASLRERCGSFVIRPPTTTTTTAAPTTTVAPTTTTVAVVANRLPTTGSSSISLAAVGFTLLLTGIALWASRRLRPARADRSDGLPS